MKKKIRKIMSAMLVVAMMTTLIPVNAFAANSKGNDARAKEFSITLKGPAYNNYTPGGKDYWQPTVTGEGLYSGTLTIATGHYGVGYGLTLTAKPSDGFVPGKVELLQVGDQEFAGVKIKITAKSGDEIEKYLESSVQYDCATAPFNSYVGQGLTSGDYTSLTGTFTPNEYVETQKAPTPIGVTGKATSNSITLTDPTNANNGAYGNTEYSWDDGKTWTTEKVKTGLKANTDYKVLVRFAGKDNYTVSDNATFTVRTGKEDIAALKNYLETIKPVDKTIAYKDGLTLADKGLAQANGWTWKYPDTLIPVEKTQYDVVLNTGELEKTYDFTGFNLAGYTYDPVAHTLTTKVYVTVTKGTNPNAANLTAPTVKNITATSFELANLKAGQEYSIDGKTWIAQDKITTNTFTGLEQNKEYTIKTRIPATDKYEEVTNSKLDVKATTLSTIHGKVEGDDMPATLTIIVNGKEATATIDKTGGTYSIELPAGKYEVKVMGKDELQSATVNATVAGDTVVDIEMKDTAKGKAKKIVEENLIDPETKKPIVGITPSNVGIIIDFEDEWKTIPEDVQDEIDKLLAPKTYEELLDEAKKFIDEESDKFISEITDPTTGLIFDPTVGIGIDEIIGAEDEWEELPDEVKKVINEKIAPKTYEELLDEAKKFVDEESDKFIKTYVSDEKGNIYKDADKDNYKQILSGEDEWNKKSQAEKDAINAKLLANGGKTYEELLKLAKEVEAQILAEKDAEDKNKEDKDKEDSKGNNKGKDDKDGDKVVKTGDPTDLEDYMAMLGASGLLLALLLAYRRKDSFEDK